MGPSSRAASSISCRASGRPHPRNRQRARARMARAARPGRAGVKGGSAALRCLALRLALKEAGAQGWETHQTCPFCLLPSVPSSANCSPSGSAATRRRRRWSSRLCDGRSHWTANPHSNSLPCHNPSAATRRRRRRSSRLGRATARPGTHFSCAPTPWPRLLQRTLVSAVSSWHALLMQNREAGCSTAPRA